MHFPLIQIATEHLSENLNKRVHVVGWNPKSVFLYLGTDLYGQHILRTPKTGKIYKTMNALAYTRRREKHGN